jgi:polyphenol oxidase
MTPPHVPETFEWTQETWGLALRCRPLSSIAPHAFSTRQLDVSIPNGERELADAVGADSLVMVTQVHGRDVVVVQAVVGTGERARTKAADAGHARPEADVLVSNAQDVAIVMRSADCAPILMADVVTGAVAAVHAGWRGTAARVVVAAVEALGREFGARPEHLVVAIGPTIGPCCYEVGSELVDAFASTGHERHLINRWFSAPPPLRGSIGRPPLRLDIAGANRDQLILAGVTEAQVYVCGLCTAMHLDVLTSFRAEQEKSGRLAGVIRAR